MKASWTIAHDHHLIVVTLSGAVSRADIETCLATMHAARVEDYRCVFDLSGAVLDLGIGDMHLLAQSLVAADGPQRGPLALLVPPAIAETLREAVRLEIRTGGDIAIFAATDGEREWLASLTRAAVTH